MKACPGFKDDKGDSIMKKLYWVELEESNYLEIPFKSEGMNT
tara:strand:- start:1502 stop:1627 length:126 start_codon:yes stop_codon:yes gene_type:complete